MGIVERKKKYEGMSLIEMLITIVILGIVLIVVAMTLTAMIKASAISSAKTLSRNESEFIFEIIKRNIKNAKADDILLFNVEGRGLNADGMVIDTDPGQVELSYSQDIEAGSGIAGNEIQIRPTGSDEWVCIAWYPYAGLSTAANATPVTYIVRNVSAFSGPDCMSGAIPVPLNEEEITISEFAVTHYTTTSGNTSFIVDLEVIPLHWVPGPQSAFKPEYRRQLIVTTEKLTF